MAIEPRQTNEQLRASIAELKRQMQVALDEKERNLLGGIVESIGGGQAEPPAEVLDNPEEITEQLEAQAVNFESRHPKLAGAIREVMDVLAKMGI